MRKIHASVELPDNSGRLVVFEWAQGSEPDENLLCFEPNGRVRWKAKLPTTDLGDCFVDVTIEGGLVRAKSMSCYAVWLDPQTGEVVRMQFTK